LKSFVQFQLKPINFDGMSKSSSVILNFLISQDTVSIQIRRGGIFCNSYIESFQSNLTVKEFWKSVYICQSYD